MIQIDGSRFSGSGTLVRTGLALAGLLGQPLRLQNIRSRRTPAGLRPQHVQAARALADLTGGSLKTAETGSSELEFLPGGPARAGSYSWDIGSAGSTTLLALTLLSPALFSGGRCRFQLTGGLFQDFAPSAYHFQYALLPLLARMGARLQAELIRPGYVPKGGGLLSLQSEPLREDLRAFALQRRENEWDIWGVALSSHLEERGVSDRMAESCLKALRSAGFEAHIQVVHDHSAAQPGAALALFAENADGAILGADGAGARGRPSEAIGQAVAGELINTLSSGATVDRHLADQLILFAALARGTSEYRIPELTEHVRSSCWLVESILGARTDVSGRQLHIEGIGFQAGAVEVVKS